MILRKWLIHIIGIRILINFIVIKLKDNFIPPCSKAWIWPHNWAMYWQKNTSVPSRKPRRVDSSLYFSYKYANFEEWRHFFQGQSFWPGDVSQGLTWLLYLSPSELYNYMVLAFFLDGHTNEAFFFYHYTARTLKGKSASPLTLKHLKHKSWRQTKCPIFILREFSSFSIHTNLRHKRIYQLPLYPCISTKGWGYKGCPITDIALKSCLT